MRKFTLMLSVLLLSACAVTPQRTPGADSYYFDCDTPAAKFSEWNRTIAGTSFRITGSIELREPREDPHWQTVGSVWLVGTTSQRMGLQALVVRDSPDRLQFRLRQPGAADPPAVFVSTRWRDGAVPFTLTLDRSGAMSAEIAGKSVSVPVGSFVVGKFALTCSTADFHFTDINVAVQ